MNEISSFMFSEHTVNNYSVIGAGLCLSTYKHAIASEIKEKIRELDMKAAEDPFYVDYILASYIKKISPRHLFAVGLSICIPGVKGPTGGVIGNPFQSISSASGISEYIDNGLSTAAYPGGPGIIIKGTPELAETIIKTVNPGDGGIKTLSKMVETTMKFSVSIGIIVTDGTGTINPGVAATIDNGVAKFMTIGRGE